MKHLFAILVLCTLAFNAQAETLYVSDKLEITLRKGQSTRHEILRMLPSGTPLTILETDTAAGYARVRTPGGAEGWVLTRFLMTGRAARERLAQAEARLAELELDNRKRVTQYKEIDSKQQGLVTERDSLQEENRKLGQQLAEIRRTASSALAIDSENKRLKSHIVEVERDLQAITQENQSLKDQTARDWFMVGAGVVLLGIIVGLIIPRIRWRKKSSWDTF